MTRNHLTMVRMAGAASALALTAALIAAPGPAGADEVKENWLTERLAFEGAVSITVTQRLEGLDPQEVEIEDGSHFAVAEFTLPPETVFPWHTHPGTLLIGVEEGEFVIVFAEDCVERELSAGSVIVDPGDAEHLAWNPSSDSETVLVATYLGVPEEGPLTLPVDEDEAAALDESCAIEAPGEHAH
jgi:quercetin dioxygenase-like cupin family protein